MTHVGNKYGLSVKLRTILSACDKIEMEELGYTIPKDIPVANVIFRDDARDLAWFKDWYRSYIKDHIESGTVNQIRFAK